MKSRVGKLLLPEIGKAKSRIERIKNEHIKKIVGMKEKSDIIDSIERKRLQWNGHVKRMQEERLPKLIMQWIRGREGKEDVQEKRGWKVCEQP
jgi:hypothetical protein